MNAAESRIVLSIRDLEVHRGEHFRLRLPRLEAAAGETLAVLGPNGAGKSTFLEILALLRRPDAGEVRIRGEVAKSHSDRLRIRRRLSLAMQDPFLLAGSLLDNVALPLRLRGIAKNEARARARPWLTRFGIAELAQRPGRAVSGGEARRASLARALVTDPDLLLLDEPFSALDPPTRDTLLLDFQRALPPSTAVVLVTHDRSEALTLAQQVAVLDSGHLLQWDTVQEVFHRPASESVATLVGLETILSGTVRESADGLCRVEVSPAVVVEASGEAAAGARVRLCVHPEEVTIERDPRPAQTTARNVFSARIRAVRPHGPARRVEMECPFALAALVTRRSAEELDLKPGDEVAASFKASAVHVFPARERAG
ncbi:MAG: ABC transporter ATP-binding protein [Acidobacteriota bacterium]